MEIAIAIGRRCESHQIRRESTMGILIGGVTKGRCGRNRACDDRWIKGESTTEIIVGGSQSGGAMGSIV